MTITTNQRSTRWRLTALTAACLLALLLSACGSVGGDGGSPTASEAAGAEDAWLKAAQCLRENGVPAEVGEGGGITLDRDANIDSDTFEKAQQACQDLIEAAEPKEAGEPLSAEDKQTLLAQAQCMRQRGWEQPDPEFLGGSKVWWEPPPNVDLNDPQYQKDVEECQQAAGAGKEQSP